VINLQGRYLNTAPYCNAFLPPPESGIPTAPNGAYYSVTPAYNNMVAFSCNFELDSFAAFLQISHDYYNATHDLDFFGHFQWISAVQSILGVATDMMEPTYAPDGSALQSSYTFQSQTMSFTGTLGNFGLGNPVKQTGLIRSPFRPSDDSSLYQFLIPSNMMFARYLEAGADIMALLPNAPAGLARQMADMAASLREAVDRYAIVPSPTDARTQIYAYEVDGYGGRNLMDDANIPSLLSLPLLGYLDWDDPVYQNTRRFVLSDDNPWFSRGSVISAVGSPHIKPGTAWPMASIVRILTTNDDAEIEGQLKELVSSTAGLGLIHESVNSFSQNTWTRQW
jgi:meiotically up-regulated gene 157 (Mug157) protein